MGENHPLLPGVNTNLSFAARERQSLPAASNDHPKHRRKTDRRSDRGAGKIEGQSSPLELPDITDGLSRSCANASDFAGGKYHWSLGTSFGFSGSPS